MTNLGSLFLGMDHIGIKTIDIEEAIKFYVDNLGFELIKRVKPGRAELVFLQLGATVLELVEVVDGVKFEDGIVNHIAFRVADIFKATNWLKERNVTLLQEEPVAMKEGCYNLFFRGPSGERLELFQGEC